MKAKDPLEGKIIYVLIMTLLVQFLYPFSISDQPIVQISYQIFYTSLFVVGVYLVSENRLVRNLLMAATLVWVVLSLLLPRYPTAMWMNLSSYATVAVFQITLTVVLFNYIFRMREVSRDVLLAACTVYLLLGAIFIPIYGTIEVLTWNEGAGQHAFVDGNQDYGDAPIYWQTFAYYSYSTLTTLGYGDVLPVTPWARSVATFEASVGVLYTAVIVARLVGLYAAKEVEDDLMEEQERKGV